MVSGLILISSWMLHGHLYFLASAVKEEPVEHKFVQQIHEGQERLLSSTSNRRIRFVVFSNGEGQVFRCSTE